MYCVFCQADDLPALWAYRGLKQRGLEPLDVFTPEALVYNRRLEHRLGAGGTITCLELADGRVLDGAKVQGVLNRINYLPIDHFRLAEPDDRAYAGLEQQAIFLSWMHALPGVVINRPGPRGLCGEFRSPAEWTWLAAQAGLSVPPFHQSDDQTLKNPPLTATTQLIVFDSQVFGASAGWCDDAIKNAIKRLADLSGLRLLGLGFTVNPSGEPLFASVTASSDLRLGGEALLDALMGMFA